MCGIAGYVRSRAVEEPPHAVSRMTRELRHRGPDDEGLTLIDPTGGRGADFRTDHSASACATLPSASDAAPVAHAVAFGQCRFSIFDLSPGGHQPFWSAARDVCVTFNGEIYNHVELRRELESIGHSFRTRCDTEVFVEAYRAWGTECFGRFRGFWAAALYDARRRAVLLTRDRLGKAPMYLARHGGTLWFASEIGAILAVTGRAAFPVRRQAVADFMAHSWRDVGHKTFYEGVESFPSASFAWVRGEDGTFDPQRYWTLPVERMSERQMPVPEAMAEFRRRLDESVELRLRADVPVGFELSGGLDSSCLIAAAASHGRRVHAYTVSFPGTAVDETPYARLVCEHYREQVEHTVLRPPDDDFWTQADEYVGRSGEPFHAPNMVTNRGVWREMSRRGVRVSVNGAAGDEAWAGYFNDYYEPFLRDLLRRGRWGDLLRNARLFGDPPHRLGSPVVLRRLLRAFWRGSRPPDDGTLNGACVVSSPGSRLHVIPEHLNPLRLDGVRPQRGASDELEPRLRDLMGDWRMNYWLRAANTSFMSVPTEVRCPFLDHELVELAFRLPVTYLIRDGWLKWLVRVAMADRLPPEVVWRKRKMGFPFPYEQWALASRPRFVDAARGADCPYVDPIKLESAYDALARTNPVFLWRLMSVCLWWKKCVMGERLY